MVRRTFRSSESLKQLLHRTVPSYSLRKYPGFRLQTVQDLGSIGLSREDCAEQEVGENYVGREQAERDDARNCPNVLRIFQSENSQEGIQIAIPIERE